MMKNSLSVCMMALISCCFGQEFRQEFVTNDISNFWNAYDQITQVDDTAKQYQLLHQLYFEKGSPGLESLIQVRNYTDREFIHAIRNYPEFWESIRQNTYLEESIKSEIEADILKLKQLYPELKPAPIYFSIGAFRTNGTIHNGRVLIGCELSMADTSTRIHELPAWRQPYYREYEPRKNVALLCIHEYIHTQQKDLFENLLAMCLYEGVAEFVSCLASEKPSSVPAIAFGKANREKVFGKFAEDLFLPENTYNWLWGQNQNELEIRDLGYYVGYEICEQYYNNSKNKKQALKELIELDYSNEKEMERIVNSTGLLPKSIKRLKKEHESKK